LLNRVGPETSCLPIPSQRVSSAPSASLRLIYEISGLIKSQRTLKILALDTATEACSAALSVADEVQERFVIAPRGHAGLILPMVDALLAEAGLAPNQLDAIAFGRGPGSFTGIRIGTGVVQGIAFGADLPVVPISSLAALAQGAAVEMGTEQLLVALDARMGEVYWGAYRMDTQGLVRLDGQECVVPPTQVPLPPEEDWNGAGSGWGVYAEILRIRLRDKLARWEAEHYPHARDVARLGEAGLVKGQAVSAEQALPVYLRDRVARRPH
jgi:tRNA threonylcarbamoyladenosine biosynthesis protein TsaB